MLLRNVCENAIQGRLFPCTAYSDRCLVNAGTETEGRHCGTSQSVGSRCGCRGSSALDTPPSFFWVGLEDVNACTVRFGQPWIRGQIREAEKRQFPKWVILGRIASSLWEPGRRGKIPDGCQMDRRGRVQNNLAQRTVERASHVSYQFASHGVARSRNVLFDGLVLTGAHQGQAGRGTWKTRWSRNMDFEFLSWRSVFAQCVASAPSAPPDANPSPRAELAWVHYEQHA